MTGYRLSDPYREQRNASPERYCTTSDGDERRRIRQDLLKLAPPPSWDHNWRFEPDPSNKRELAPAEISPQPLVGDLKLEIAP
jgi:hypothetical protein